MAINSPSKKRPKEPPRCEGCPFIRTVGAKGNPEAPFVIVGESPGSQEVREGIPFAGPSGKVLHTFIPEEDVYVINAFQCFPGTSSSKVKKEDKLLKAANCCHQRMVDQILAHPRRIVLGLGRWAAGSLLGDYNVKITKARGKLYKSPLAELGVFLAIHPAALMRGTGSFRQWREDILYAYEMSKGAAPKEYTPCTYEEIDIDDKGMRKAKQVVAKLLKENKGKVLVGDVETTGLNPARDYILTFGVTTEEEHVYCFQPEHFETLKPLMEHPKIEWGWHNGKFDVQFFWHEGIKARVDHDTMLMSYAMDETGGIHDLESIANDALGAPDYKYMIDPYVSVKEKKESGYKMVWERAPHVLNEYMALDVGNTERIRKRYYSRICSDERNSRLYHKTLIPASNFLAQVEMRGMYVDKERIAENAAFLTDELLRAEQQIKDLVGETHNPASPDQVAGILFDKYNLPHKKGDRSTSKEVLEGLPQIPYVKALRSYRKLAKAYGTYVKGMLKHILPDGRIHATFKIHGTRTGRLSSSDPNLQNIPRDPRYRGMFIPAPGYIFVEGDLNQAELRSLACVSGDPTMVAIYCSETTSMHDETSQALFGEVYDEDQRTRAKALNFGIVYGRTAYTIAEEFGIDLEEAQRWLDVWAERFPVAWNFIRRCRSAPIRGATLATTFGRRKRVGIVTRDNIRALQNEASNFPHQSIASDITLHAGIRVAPKLRKLGVHAVCLVHDNIVTEVPDDKGLAREVAYILRDAMETTAPLWGLTRVPFKADMKWGYRWGSNDKLKL